MYTLNEANQWPHNRKYQNIGRYTSNIVLLDISLSNSLIQTEMGTHSIWECKKMRIVFTISMDFFVISVDESRVPIDIMQIDLM